MENAANTLGGIGVAVYADITADGSHHQEGIDELKEADICAGILSLALDEKALLEGIEIDLHERSKSLLGVPEKDHCAGHWGSAWNRRESDAVYLRLNIGDKLHRCRP